MRPQANEIRKEYRKGPFCVRVLADKDSMSIAESTSPDHRGRGRGRLRGRASRFGEKLGEFGIRDYREDPPRLTPEGKIITGKVYTLEPFLSGDYTISPMQVRFRNKAEGKWGG